MNRFWFFAGMGLSAVLCGWIGDNSSSKLALMVTVAILWSWVFEHRGEVAPIPVRAFMTGWFFVNLAWRVFW